ncbi:uncharacterized protein LOC117174537 [Belonocnema kinseyi]|uniref:uncharacterized protein LOC117174537 n=1 Tax=Belonocnema kinseyi TaxID=2817044 RepID=UPI00143DC620|nr:uncharacterized protein LOC117174537 [Belonocnema kinseyi]
MEMVERGELSLVTMTKDEKGRFKNEYSKLCAENTDLTKRLKDFDRTVQERDDLRKQVNVLVENCLQMESDIRKLRKNNRTEELLKELMETSTHKDQLRMQLDKIVKDSPAVLRVCGESITKIVHERDQLRLKLTEYLSMEEDIKLLKLRASQAETHRKEAEKLKSSFSELEEIKASYMALVDKNGQNLDLVSPSDREKYRNICQELNYLKQVEIQKQSLAAENLIYRQTLDRQEIEIKELLEIIDRLNLNLKTYKVDQKNPVEGLPEGPDIRNFLSHEEKNKVEKIRERILDATQKPTRIKIQVLRKPTRNSGGLSILLDILKYLGFFLRREKSSRV